VVLGLGHKEIVSLLSKRLPAILTDLSADPSDVGMPVVNFDYTKAYANAFAAIHTLHRTGKIAIIDGYNDERMGNCLINSEVAIGCIVQASQKSNIICENEHILSVKIDSDSHVEVTEQIASQLCDLIKNKGVSIICPLNLGNPNLLQQCLIQRGISLPEDAVIITRNHSPFEIKGVITLVQDWTKMFSTAVEVLAHRIDTPTEICGQYLVPCKQIFTEMIK